MENICSHMFCKNVAAGTCICGSKNRLHCLNHLKDHFRDPNFSMEYVLSVPDLFKVRNYLLKQFIASYKTIIAQAVSESRKILSEVRECFMSLYEKVETEKDKLIADLNDQLNTMNTKVLNIDKSSPFFPILFSDEFRTASEVSHKNYTMNSPKPIIKIAESLPLVVNEHESPDSQVKSPEENLPAILIDQEVQDSQGKSPETPNGIHQFIVYPPEHQTKVETIGKTWIPIEQMKEEYIYNESFKNFVDLLKANGICGWKKVRGDGNCYYRAVIVSYIEQLQKPYFHRSLQVLIDLIHSESEISSKYENFLSYKSVSIYYLEMLQSIPDRVEAFATTLKYFQDPDFDKVMVNTLRMLTADYLVKHANSPELSPYIEDLNALIHNILTEEEEAGEITLALAPSALNARVHQFLNLNGDLRLEIFPNQFFETDIEIQLVRKIGGHYDLVYLENVREIEGFDFNTGAYTIQY